MDWKLQIVFAASSVIAGVMLCVTQNIFFAVVAFTALLAGEVAQYVNDKRAYEKEERERQRERIRLKNQLEEERFMMLLASEETFRQYSRNWR